MTTYTPEQLRQIDVQVAQVMGYEVEERRGWWDGEYQCFRASRDNDRGSYSAWCYRVTGAVWQELPEFTTRIEPAWLCIDYMRERGWRFGLYEFHRPPLGWVASFVRESACPAEGESAPLAICLAFLAASGVEVAV